MKKTSILMILVLSIALTGCGLFIKRAPDITLTGKNNNQTITLQKHQRIVIQVASGYYWFNFVGSPAILKQVVGANDVPDNAGIYQGAMPGRTFLDLRGEAICKQDPIPCNKDDLHYRFTVEVLDSP